MNAMLLDSNILIYSVNPAYPQLRDLVADKASVVSAVSYVEVLGFHKLPPAEKLDLEQVFAAIAILPITRAVMDGAVHLRQQRKMTLGDSLIGATALIHNLTLATHNTSDFAWIKGLTVHDPLVP
jgi:toxin FitB